MLSSVRKASSSLSGRGMASKTAHEALSLASLEIEGCDRMWDVRRPMRRGERILCTSTPGASLLNSCKAAVRHAFRPSSSLGRSKSSHSSFSRS